MEILTYANKYSLYLFVTISRGRQAKSFKMTVKEFKKSLKRYKAYYNAIEVSHSYNDYETDIVLDNGIKFNVILY